MTREFSSFRDPSGHMFWRDGIIYRWVSQLNAEQFHQAQRSGLYHQAIAAKLLLPFEQCDLTAFRDAGGGEAAAILKPRQISTITYPYEWSFSQLAAAALATLDVHLLALSHGMMLKDASAFNIQFVDGHPQLIDHLSFASVDAHSAWPAYGQFCRHFLAPLLLMSHVDLSFGRLSQIHLDGVPLGLASKLLPRRTLLSPGVQMHLHLHARMSEKYSDHREKVAAAKRNVSSDGLRAIATSLRDMVAKLKPIDQITEWGDYYSDTNYSADAIAAKKQMIRDYVKQIAPARLLDLGGNDGSMSRAVRDLAASIICLDIDPRAVDYNYRQNKSENISSILPLLADVTNPPPAVGFANKERPALFDRLKTDAVMALALVHHLAISNNLPLSYIARFLGALAPSLIIEFVPKSDSQVKRLLANREDVFPDYTEQGFVEAFSAVFAILEQQRIPGTERTLYLMSRHADRAN